MSEKAITDTKDWKWFSHPNFPLRFLYPSPTPQGSIVQITERSTPDGPLVHLCAEDPDELYFEVMRSNRSAEEGYRQMREALAHQFGEVDLSPLVRGERASCATWETSFRFGSPAQIQERSVVYFERGLATYRILFRPHSPLNGAVLDTLSFIEGT
jgi:hypothetical protein